MIVFLLVIIVLLLVIIVLLLVIIHLLLVIIHLFYPKFYKMRDLSDDEFSGWMGKGKASPFYLAIIGLIKEKGLFISKEEWNRCRTPSRICRYLEKKFNVKYVCRNVTGGWEIRRV